MYNKKRGGWEEKKRINKLGRLIVCFHTRKWKWKWWKVKGYPSSCCEDLPKTHWCSVISITLLKHFSSLICLHLFEYKIQFIEILLIHVTVFTITNKTYIHLLLLFLIGLSCKPPLTEFSLWDSSTTVSVHSVL